MKATWERNEQITLMNLCKNSWCTARSYRDDIKAEIYEYNAAIDDLPWYKQIFKFKADFFGYPWNIFNPLNTYFRMYGTHNDACWDIRELMFRIETCFTNGAASITLSDTEIELLIKYTQFYKRKK